MSNNYMDKKFPDKIKEFHNYDSNYFVDIIDKTCISITKNLHPIIAYNYPDILHKFFNENDLSNILKSPSIMLHYKREGLFQDKLDKSQFDLCEVIKQINNKTYTREEVENALSTIWLNSKRQRSTYSKAYPELHDKFEDVKDNYDYNMSLIALEHGDSEYIKNNIDYIIKRHKERLKESWWESFYYLDESDFTDQDILKFIDHNELVIFSKYESTIFKFWEYHKSTKYVEVHSLPMFNKAVEMGLDISLINEDWLNENAELVIKHYPYFYTILNDDNKKDKNIQYLAMKDPYNIGEIGLNEDNIKHFLNCSNINVLEAYEGLCNLDIDYKSLLLKEIDKFEGTFLALQAYPILILLLDDQKYYKHVSPYLINHSCKIDENMFEYFKFKEKNRCQY